MPFKRLKASRWKQPFPFGMGLAVVVSRNSNYQGPIGAFDNTLQMGYPRVFQVGISGEI